MFYMKCYSFLNGFSCFKIEEKIDLLNLIFFFFIFEINLKKKFFFENCYNSWLKLYML